jgi:hypothetical protein
MMNQVNPAIDYQISERMEVKAQQLYGRNNRVLEIEKMKLMDTLQ